MFLQNQILNHTYQILHPIGSGGTSSVFLAFHMRLQKYVVIKQLRGSVAGDFLLRTEVDILKNLHHPNLPQVYDFFVEQNEIYTVIDFVDGYDLEAYIRASTKFPEQLIIRYLRQIAGVLDYLHSQNPSVIHSDIKPGNIIIDQAGNAILIDFNTSIGGNQGNLLGLTMPYASPEQIQLAQYAVYDQPAPFELDGRSDLFSLGAAFYELISGICPTPGVPPVPLHTMGLTEYNQDLLVLIDRLMEYDREKRIKSARKLITALDRLNGSHKKFFALRCISVIVSAALISAGVYCCIRGAKRSTFEDYISRYSEATSLIDQGYLDSAADICDEILKSSKMQAFLQDQPEELARFYHTLGDISYYQGDYATAAAYYRYAVELCDQGDVAVMAPYLRDAALAFAQCGDLATARSFLQSAKSSQISTNDLLLVTMAIDAKEGNVGQCMEAARQIINSGADRETCLRASLTAASAAADLDSRIQWLQIARQYDDGRTAARGLAVAYGEKAQAVQNDQERQAALNAAAGLYEQICGSLYASAVDRINYSVILRMSGLRQQALEVLKIARQYEPENYRVLANMCFICYELGDESGASAYCDAAIRAWRACTESDKLSASSQEIQDLLELGRRFGIGGI